MQSSSYRGDRRSHASAKRRSKYSSSPHERNFRSTGSTRKGKYRNHAHNQSRRGGAQATYDPSRFINSNPKQNDDTTFIPKHSFKTFGLNHALLMTIVSMGIEHPTPIQDAIIPEIIAGKDVTGSAETGTGKTAAFLIPLIQLIFNNSKRQTLILAPTRELAIQIDDELKKLSKRLKIYSVVCVGGANIRPQIRALGRFNHFIIGTPGRIMDLMERKCLNVSTIDTVVLDEADRMLDMGFIKDMRQILSSTPSTRQTLFFSATMSGSAKELIHDFLKSPVHVAVNQRDVIGTIEQHIIEYRQSSKFETLLNLLKQPEFKRVLIFGAMKHSVEKLAKELTAHGARAESIHGNKNYNGRIRSLAKFKSNQSRILVATDVAARGIHVEDISHVINYDLPSSLNDYIHRIGRTGRAKHQGKALTFVLAR